ncbi:hypothetical protein RJT34_22333 [Clitoria ternatea]|uniref:(S)-hydroxynitrile lyase n=1 Tax=Clitoria ternatea TaxID=43366 RepID=A0AAN9P6Y8_CLITE
MDSLKVTIDAEQNTVSVYNNGDGVPVVIHQEEKVCVPELIFGHLLTSSNYDNNVKKTTGGRNGYGAKLTNIFSTEFVIETADGKRQKKYKQVFNNNTGKKSEPAITKCKDGENWTKVTFKPDLEKFKMTYLEEDVVALMKKRVLDMAGCLGKAVKVELNGRVIRMKSFRDYADLYLKSAEKNRPVPLPRYVNEKGDYEYPLSMFKETFSLKSSARLASIVEPRRISFLMMPNTNRILFLRTNKSRLRSAVLWLYDGGPWSRRHRGGLRSREERRERERSRFFGIVKKEIRHGSTVEADLVMESQRKGFTRQILIVAWHFVLVHGGSHGAWCWYKVATLLKSAGHNVTALDLAGCGINPKQVHEIRSISEYYEPLMTFMDSVPPKEKVILVCHSFGGISVSVAMEKFPEKISVAVFVTASVINENFTAQAAIEEMLRVVGPLMTDTQYSLSDVPNKPPTALLLGPKAIASNFYQFSPSEDLALALSLLRPHPIFNDVEALLKETTITQQRNGSVPKVYIISKGDKIKTEDSQLWVIERTGPYAEVKVIADSDHMESKTKMESPQFPKHFVLVHGGCHGAWCWYKVATLLKSAGHNVTALDLAGCGINPKQVHEIRSISDYYEPLMTFMDSVPPKEKVILVCHSFGGISVSVAMEKFPEKISVAVFVTASAINENLTAQAAFEEFAEMTTRMGSLMDTHYFFLDGPNKPPTALLLGPKAMTSNFYQLSPPEDLALALSLLRPHPIFNDVEALLKETTITQQRNGSVPKVYIISKGDKIKTEESQLWIIERTGPYAEVKVIADSDHMAMLSKPKELVTHILSIANNY